jgi:lipopolysaccharide export system permease protein
VKVLIILDTYLRTGGKEQMRGKNTDVYRQINDNEFLYVNSFNAESQVAFQFALEKFDKEKLVSKITASRIKWSQRIVRIQCMTTQKNCGSSR